MNGLGVNVLIRIANDSFIKEYLGVGADLAFGYPQNFFDTQHSLR